MAYKILEHIELLGELGCSPDKIEPILYSISNSELDEMIYNMKQKVTEWKERTSSILYKYSRLLLVNMPKLLQVYSLITREKVISDEGIRMITHEVSFLTSNNSNNLSTQKKIMAGVKVINYAFIT